MNTEIPLKRTKEEQSDESSQKKSEDLSPTPLSPGDRPRLYPSASKPQPSYLENLFSSGVSTTNPQFEGAIQLSFILLALLVVISTYKKMYSRGWLFFEDLQVLSCVLAEAGIVYLINMIEGVATFLLLFLYKKFVNNRISRTTLLWLYRIWQILFFIAFLKAKLAMTPFFTSISVMGTIVYALKMHSFVATNLLLHTGDKNKPDQTLADETRTKLKSIVDKESHYPNNVNMANYAYFIFCAPSLVYETKFQRTQRVRVLYVIKELCAFAFCATGVLWITGQYVLPVVAATGDDSFVRFLDDLSQVCVPTFVLWLLGFYAYFHCWLNAKSELVRYANREFYQDWWNSASIGEFWRKWNLPVHEWCLRHVYIESMYYFKASKDMATFYVFLVSAILHEVVGSLGFKNLKPYFFFAMFMQVPLALLNKKLKNMSKRTGNILMWISVMLGQPLLEILYYRDWLKENDASKFWCR